MHDAKNITLSTQMAIRIRTATATQATRQNAIPKSSTSRLNSVSVICGYRVVGVYEAETSINRARRTTRGPSDEAGTVAEAKKFCPRDLRGEQYQLRQGASGTGR